jgi:hypothetical protein
MKTCIGLLFGCDESNYDDDLQKKHTYVKTLSERIETRIAKQFRPEKPFYTILWDDEAKKLCKQYKKELENTQGKLLTPFLKETTRCGEGLIYCPIGPYKFKEIVAFYFKETKQSQKSCLFLLFEKGNPLYKHSFEALKIAKERQKNQQEVKLSITTLKTDDSLCEFVWVYDISILQ